MVAFDVSLLGGAFPVGLAVAAIGALTAASLQQGWRWWLRRVLPVVVGSLAIAAFVNWWLDLRGRFGEVIPVQFIAYAALPLVAIGVAACGWGTNGRWRRVISIACVPLMLLYAANLVNQYYEFEPTVGALFGARFEDQLEPAALELRTVVPNAAPTSNPTSNPAVSAPSAAPERSSADVAALVYDGVLTQLTIPGTISHFAARPSWVWVPPAFLRTPRPPLPVIVILAGTPGQPDNMIRAGRADKVAERYASTHGGVAPILVFADENGSFTADTECVDSPRGNAETYLTRDLPAFISQAFATMTGPAHWAIEGYSEGGTCALVLALAHPDVFGSFVDIAGDRFPNVGTRGDVKAKTIATLYEGNAALFDAHDPTLLMQRPEAQGVAAWFEAGARDRERDRIGEALNIECRRAGLDSRFLRSSGGHDFGLAARGFADSFEWLAGRIGT